MARIRPIPGRQCDPLDEQACHFDSPAEPNNVHIEVRLADHLQEDALRAATLAALNHEPRARFRMAPGNGWRRLRWECPPQPDVAPLSRAAWTDERDLDRIRERFLNEPVPLLLSPPVRVLLASGPAQDSVILKAHHAAGDGISCLNLLRLVARYYREDPRQRAGPGGESCAGDGATRHAAAQPGSQPWPPGPARRPATAGVPAATAQSAGIARLAGTGRPASTPQAPGTTPARHRATRIAGLLMAPPVRIASQRSPGRRTAAGYGVVTMTCSPVPAPPRTLAPGPLAGPRPTVNDLLVAALIEAVRRWNAARDRPVSPVRITVPMNARTPGQAGAAGNLCRLTTVTAAEPAPGAGLAVGAGLVAEVSRQLTEAKGDRGGQASTPGPAIAAWCAAVLRRSAAWCPPVVRRATVRATLRLAGSRVCDTSLLSNLGEVADAPRFAAAPPESILFSTPAHMPRGLSVGAVTASGRLHLCFRYRRALFDDAAAREFAAGYAAALSDMSAEPLAAVGPTAPR